MKFKNCVTGILSGFEIWSFVVICVLNFGVYLSFVF
jgi:hypothetical protein